jgi:hypothetical protein
MVDEPQQEIDADLAREHAPEILRGAARLLNAVIADMKGGYRPSPAAKKAMDEGVALVMKTVRHWK